MVRPWTHWATSLDLLSLRMPAHDAGTGLHGETLGQSQYGSSFVLDVFDAYGAGLVSNPNVIVAGSIGAGKSRRLACKCRFNGAALGNVFQSAAIRWNLLDF